MKAADLAAVDGGGGGGGAKAAPPVSAAAAECGECVFGTVSERAEI